MFCSRSNRGPRVIEMPCQHVLPQSPKHEKGRWQNVHWFLKLPLTMDIYAFLFTFRASHVATLTSKGVGSVQPHVLRGEAECWEHAVNYHKEPQCSFDKGGVAGCLLNFSASKEEPQICPCAPTQHINHFALVLLLFNEEKLELTSETLCTSKSILTKAHTHQHWV